MTDLSHIKDEVRQSLLTRRSALSVDEVAQMSLAIQERLLKHRLWAAAESVGLYSAVKNEVETILLFHKALEQGKSVYYPRVEQGLKFYEVRERDQLVKGAWGILEPRHGCPMLLENEKLDLLIVPGVVFDMRGFRVGYGKGFYDIFLKSLPAQTVGLAYDFQIVPEISTEDWDVPVGTVMTEKRLLPVTDKASSPA